MVYGSRARRYRSRRYGGGGRPRRYVYRAPFRRVRRNYVPSSAFSRPKRFYSASRPGRFLTRKCAGLVRKVHPWVDQPDPSDPTIIRRKPKSGWVAVTISTSLQPPRKRVRYFRTSQTAQAVRFVARRAGGVPFFAGFNDAQLNPFLAQVQAGASASAITEGMSEF